MVYEPINSPSTRISLLIQNPRFAWGVIIALFAIAIVGAIAGLGRLLNYIIPAFSLAIGIYLYSYHRFLYIGFAFWLWFLIAFLRRLADYWGSYTEPSPMLLAPFLVTAITILPALVKLPRAKADGVLPFAMASLGVMYGFAIGLTKDLPIISLLQAFLGWMTPITFGWYMYLNWRQYPQHRQNIQRIFIWGTFVIGVYGIIQFISLPEWDRLWLVESGMFSSQGMPAESTGVRIWSTLHSGEPFAAFMSVGLLLLLSVFGALPFLASIPGYLALLLSTVRSGWLGWAAGLAVMVTNLKPNIQIRLISLALITSLAVIPLSMYEPFAEKIMPRLATFSNLEEDGSGKARQGIYLKALERSEEAVIGRGLGQGVGDSGILSLFFQLGLIGGFLYLGGMVLVILKIFSSFEISSDIFATSVKAGIMSCIVRLPFNGVLAGGSGFLLWALLGLGLASISYTAKQSATRSKMINNR